MHFFEKISIRRSIALMIIIFVLIPSSIITTYLYSFTIKKIQNQYLDNYVQSFSDNMESAFTNYISQVNLMSLDLATHPPLYASLIAACNDGVSNEDEISAILGYFVENSQVISAIDIILDNDTVYHSPNVDITSDVTNTPFFQQFNNNTLSIYSGNVYDKNGNTYICFGKYFFNYVNSYRIGKILLYVKSDIIKDLYAGSLLPDSDLFITVNDCVLSTTKSDNCVGRLLYIPKVFKSNKKDTYQQGDNVYYCHSISSALLQDDIKLMLSVSHHQLISVVKLLLVKLFFLFFGTVVFVIFSSLLLSKKLTTKINNLASKIFDFSEDISRFVPIKPSSEISILETSFNEMSQKILNLIESNNTEKENKRIAELNALQAQINPHFLYNSLDVISCMAKLNNERGIEEITVALASFFRISLHKGDNIISIREELEHVKNFLYIEEIRFPDYFSVTYDIDERILDCKIVKIVLQPLVENSIKHGFLEIPYKGEIIIRGYINDDHDIILEVEDNGKGITKSTDAIFSGSKNYGGYGLFNVNERLHIEYGDTYGLTIKNMAHNTIISIKIPMDCTS